jgi:hypothetical protein
LTSTEDPAGARKSERHFDAKTDSQKNGDDGDKAVSPDTGPTAVTVDATQQLPVFLSLPWFLAGALAEAVATPPTGGKTDAVDIVPPVSSQTNQTPASAVAASQAQEGATIPNQVVPDLAAQGQGPAQQANDGQPPKIVLAKALVPAGSATPEAVEKNGRTQNSGDYQPAKIESAAPPASTATATPPASEQSGLSAETASGGTAATAMPVPGGTASAADLQTMPSAEKATANAGTGVATTEMQMKNSQKTNNVAGMDAKVLPVADNGEPDEKILPPSPSLVRVADNRGSDLHFAFPNGDDHAPAAESTPLVNAIDLPSLADARTRSLDRAHDMVALHAMRLVESNSDTLSVVIKPAVGTELSLELRLHPDGVEARARLTRGDHEFLSQHWPELQQRLEQRGIKLASLGGEMNSSANGNSQFQRRETSEEDAAQQASAFAEFAAAGAGGGATARLAEIHDGWESWA